MKEEVEQIVEKADLIDKDVYTAISINIREQIKNVLLKSAAIKVGFMQGFKDANDCLKEQFGVDIEFDIDEFLEKIDKTSSLEIELLSVQGMNCGEQLKNQITQLVLQNFYSNKNTTNNNNNPTFELLKREIDRIYKMQGELPSSDINRVVKPTEIEEGSKNARNSKNRLKKHRRSQQYEF